MATKTFFLNGANPDYGEEELNAILKYFLNQGVMNTQSAAWATFSDLLVSQRGAGANLSVDVAVGAAVIQITKNGATFKVIASNNAIQNVAVPSQSSGANRVGALIFRVSVSATPNALMTNVATLEFIAGTSTSPLTDNAIQTAIGSDGFIRLADITVPSGASTIVTGNIADTRTRLTINDNAAPGASVYRFTILAADPTTTLLQKGDLWFNSTTNELKYYNGTAVVVLRSSLGVDSNFGVQAQATPNTTLAVGAGVVKIGTTVVKYAGGNTPSFTAPTTNPRIDLVTIDTAGTIAITQGTENASPTAPTYPDSKYVLAEVYNKVGQTSIKNTSDGTNGYILRDVRTRFEPVPAGEYTYTAENDVVAGDKVFISSNDKVKTAALKDALSETASTTADNVGSAPRFVGQLSDGKILIVQGGNNTALGAISCVVGDINAAETDFSYGSTAAPTGVNNASSFDIAILSATSFLVIWQNVTAGAASGIKCAVATISGSTISFGSTTTIETTGVRGNDEQVCAAKLSATSVLIFYTKDSDSKMYAQVLSISGTTITTNTAVNVDANTSRRPVSLDAFTATKAACLYENTSTTTFKTRILDISGTSITVQAENSHETASGGGQAARITRLSDTKMILLEAINSTSNWYNLSILKINGNSFTQGSLVQSSNSRIHMTKMQNRCIGVVRVTDTLFIVNTNDGASSSTDYNRTYEVGDTTLTAIGSELSHNMTSCDYGGGMAKIRPQKYAVGNNLQRPRIVVFNHRSTEAIGVAKTTAAKNATLQVVLLGNPAAIYSGQTAGICYYDDNAQPTTNKSLVTPKFGVATNATTIIGQ